MKFLIVWFIFWETFANVLFVQTGGNFRAIKLEQTNSTDPNVIEIISQSNTERTMNVTAAIKKPLKKIFVVFFIFF